MFKVTLLIALFAFTFCSYAPYDGIKLQGKNEFVQCVNDLGIEMTLEIRNILERIKDENDFIKLIGEIQEYIKKGYQGFGQCYRRLFAPENLLTFNWDRLINCLTKAGPTAKSVVRLIQAIRAKDYATAKSLIPELIRNGCQLVIDCLN